MPRFISFHPVVLLALALGFSMPSGRAQENTTAPPAAESFLKIINEQIAAMANTTFEMTYSYGQALAVNSPPAGEALLDENGNPLTPENNNNGADAQMTLGMRLRVDFVSLAEYRVTQMDTAGKPVFEHLSDPTKGQVQIVHLRKYFVTGVKVVNPYSLAYGVLPPALVGRYKNLAASYNPSALVWTVESHTSEKTTIALRALGKLKMRATFTRPHNMCTSLMTYDLNEQPVDVIEAVPGSTVNNLPFLASSYKNTFRGRYPKLCQTISSSPLPPGTIKPSQKPLGYTELTAEEYRKRMETEMKERTRGRSSTQRR